MEHLRNVFKATQDGDHSLLNKLGITDSELGDVKFFMKQLATTGFLD